MAECLWVMRERERENDYLHSVTERTGWTVVTMAKVGEWAWVYKLGIVNRFCRWRSPNGVGNWGEGMNWIGLLRCVVTMRYFIWWGGREDLLGLGCSGNECHTFGKC